MNLNEVREAIRQVIAEAMEKGGLPKSGGKLVHLKKELKNLKAMKEALGQYQIAEGGETSSFVAEYAHMQKFVNELEKIKAAHSKLAEMLDNQISEVEGKVSSETEKIKEMMGLIDKAKKPAVKKDDKKAEKKADKKDEKKDDKKKGQSTKNNIDLYPGRYMGDEMSAPRESKEMKEARFEKGEDIGKPGKGFAKIAKQAAKQYGSKEAGQKVAGAILKKVVAKGK